MCFFFTNIKSKNFTSINWTTTLKLNKNYLRFNAQVQDNRNLILISEHAPKKEGKIIDH